MHLKYNRIMREINAHLHAHRHPHTHAFFSKSISQLDTVCILDFSENDLLFQIQLVLNTIMVFVLGKYLAHQEHKYCKHFVPKMPEKNTKFQFFFQKADERYQCSIKRQPRNFHFDCATQHVTHQAKQHVNVYKILAAAANQMHRKMIQNNECIKRIKEAKREQMPEPIMTVASPHNDLVCCCCCRCMLMRFFICLIHPN